DVNIYNKPDPQVYRRLISECTSLGKESEFSTSITELQSNFLKDRPPKLKNLIDPVKHRYQLLGEPLPPQYAIEMLEVYAWEHGNVVTEFSTAQGFWTVLELITKHKQLQIHWTVYYDFQDQEISTYLLSRLTRAREDHAVVVWKWGGGSSVSMEHPVLSFCHLIDMRTCSPGRQRPVILDPADPTRNVVGLNPAGWWQLAGEATVWLQYPCTKNWDTSRVHSWDV
ncbi:hypothetical protein U0070_021067, partial [Myodes glareolus]